MIFVVDASDRARIKEAKTELDKILGDREMKEALLLVFANKQDLKDKMEPAEVQERLGLSQVKDRTWYVVPSCATTGDGLYEGLVCISIILRIPGCVLMKDFRPGSQTT